ERKLARCLTCPADYDEELLERLREWRKATAAAQKVPAYVVFTDATLQAVAEHVPSSTAQLSRISGVGAVKLERYGEAVLALCAGEEPTAPDGVGGPDDEQCPPDRDPGARTAGRAGRDAPGRPGAQADPRRPARHPRPGADRGRHLPRLQPGRRPAARL